MDDKSISDGLFWKDQIFGLDKVDKAQQEERRRLLEKRCADYKEVFSTPAGQRVFWDLMEQTNVFMPFMQQNAGAYVKEGRRELGLYLLAAFGFTPDPGSLAKLAMSLQAISKQKMED